LLLCLQAWQFRQLEFMARVMSRMEALEARVDPSSQLSTAPATAELCTDKLEGLAVGLDEGMTMLASVVASCSKLTTAVDALSQVTRIG
jgi:hypothetical protein